MSQDSASSPSGEVAAPQTAPLPNEVDLPDVRVLARHHVIAALSNASIDKGKPLTLWLHHTTIGIERESIGSVILPQDTDAALAGEPVSLAKRLERVLVRLHPVGTPPPATAAVLGAFVAKIGAYEPDLVQIIHKYATSDSGETHSVGDHAFRDCVVLKEVVLPRLTARIGNGAFRECAMLTEVTLPDSLTHIGTCAFFGCRGLTKLTLPNTLVFLGDNAFASCTALTTLELPDSLTRISDGAFNGCTALTAVTLPSRLTHIGEWAFNECHNLKQVNLPNSLTHIGEGAFYMCTTLAQVTMSTSVTHIDTDAFAFCGELIEMALPDSLARLGARAFYNCKSLKRVKMPKVRPAFMGADVFHGCPRTPFWNPLRAFF